MSENANQPDITSFFER